MTQQQFNNQTILALATLAAALAMLVASLWFFAVAPIQTQLDRLNDKMEQHIEHMKQTHGGN